MTSPPFDIQPTLGGNKVLLRPLVSGDYDALYAVAADPEIWAMHPVPDRHEKHVFDAFFADAIASGGALAILDKASNEVIGGTRYVNYDAFADQIEIGYTFFATRYWRTGVNREVKALMLNHMFHFVHTVVFQVGAANLRSRQAVERIGGRLVREYQRDQGGRWQDYTSYHLTRQDALSGALASLLDPM